MFTVQVIPGHTFAPGVRFTADDLNRAAQPSVVLEGAVGQSEVADGAVHANHATPGAYFFAVATGVANAYVANPSPGLSALALGVWIGFRVPVANTGAVTLNVSGLGAKAVLGPGGLALEGGELAGDQLVWVQYTGTAWMMTSAPAYTRNAYAEDTGVANACVISVPRLPVASLAALLGQEIIFKAKVTNTGAVTLAVNGLAATAIKKAGSTDLTANDILAGSLVSVVYDGTVFQLTSFVQAPALPAIGAAGATLYPYSLTIDAQGRVTGKTAGVYSGTDTVPAMGAAATFTHGLGRVPAFVRVVLVAGASPDAGCTAGDEADISNIFGGGSNDESKSFGVFVNGTTVVVARHPSPPGNQYLVAKNGASKVAFNSANWTLKVIAW